MAAEAIGYCIQQYRTLVLFKQLLLSLHYIDNCQRIVSVHPFCMHLLGVDSGTKSGQHSITHGFAAGLATHAVLVVVEVEYQGQSAAIGLIPKLLVLIHGSQADSFPYRSAAQGAVADVGNYDALLAVYLLKEGCTYGNICRAAYYGVVGIDSERREEGMHGSAKTFLEAGFASKNLSQGSIEQKVDGQFLNIALILLFSFHYTEDSTIEVAFHNFHQFFITELFNY